MELVKDILRAAQVDKHWENVLDLFVEQSGVTSACIFGVDRFSDARMGFYYSRYIRENAPEELIDKLESGDDTDDRAAYLYLLSNPAHSFRSEFELHQVTDERLMPQSDIRTESKKMGIPYRTAAALNKSGPWLDGLFTQSKDKQVAEAMSHWPLASTILPLISQSLTLGRILKELRQRYSAALAALDYLGIGVFLLDQRGNIAQKNRAAQSILDQADGISASPQGHLKISDIDTNSAYIDMIDKHASLWSQGPKTMRNMLAIPRKSLCYDYLLSVRSLTDASGELQPSMNGLFVTVIDPERRGVLSSDGLAALGQLTPSETEIATALVQGLKVNEISERRDVQENTVRMQIKALLQKLRCKSQSDVIRVAAATRLPFVD